MRHAWIILWLCAALGLRAAEVIPPAPARYFNDEARVVSPAVAERLNATLEAFEKATSNQVVVAIFAKMQSDSSIEDYTVRVAQSWKVGQKSRDNGAVLFVFIADRTMYLQVGYGLEGVLPDAIARRIIDNEIKPHFRRGDFDGGMMAGVDAILAATRGEYKGGGTTIHEHSDTMHAWIFFIVLIFILIAFSRRRGTVYAGSGRTNWGGGWYVGGGGGGGGFSSGGGGGFSGGGGSFGGGGAGGSW